MSHGLYQGNLTEGEGAILMTSSLELFVLKKRKSSTKSNWSELVSTRRSTVLSLPVQKVFPGFFLPMGRRGEKRAVKFINFYYFCRLRFYSVFALEISSLVLGSNSGGNLIKLFGIYYVTIGMLLNILTEGIHTAA